MNKNLYSIEIEQSVLSTILTVTGGADDEMNQLQPEHFYAGQHQVIFKHAKDLFLKGSSFDAVVVYDSIRINPEHNRIVDEQFMLNLMNSVSNSVNFKSHTKRLIEYASRRSLFSAGEQIKNFAIDTTSLDLDGAISKSESVLGNIQNNSSENNLHDVFGLSVNLFEKMAQAEMDRAEGKEVLEGISTGFKCLDNKIGTLKKGDLVYIGARPSMGKTAIAGDIMLSVAFFQQLPVIFHSIEMKKEKIISRFVASLAEINLKDLNRNFVPPSKWSDFKDASIQLQKTKLFIDDSSNITVADIRRNARRVKAEHGCVGAIFIDYLTLIKASEKNDRNDLMVGEVSKSLKRLAKEFDCPVICLAQLSRALEKRPDKRPLLSDLRESGSIEEDADVILFLYRDEYYNKQSKEAGTAEIIAAKVRDGEVGTVRLATELQYSRFVELDENYYQSLDEN